jgi:hypothetical protein
MATKQLFGWVEQGMPGIKKNWIARYETGETGGYFNTQAEARACIQSHAGGSPLTWTNETGIGQPERWRGEWITP